MRHRIVRVLGAQVPEMIDGQPVPPPQGDGDRRTRRQRVFDAGGGPLEGYAQHAYSPEEQVLRARGRKRRLRERDRVRRRS